MTEITDNIDIGKGILFYDGHCGACRAGAGRFGALLRRHGFALLPLQSPIATQVTGATEAELLDEIHLVTSTPRQVLRGVEAILYVAGTIPWAAPLRWTTVLPGVKPLLRAMYRAFVRNRYGISAACGLNRRADGVHRSDLGGRWTPPLVWIALAFLAGPYLPAWAWMWTLALAIYFACKWITAWPYRFTGSAGMWAGYLLGCIAMDAKSFFTSPAPPRPRAKDYIIAAAKAVAGAALIWLTPRLLIGRSDLLAGWSAMIGIALLLHFGLFHLIALLWRAGGVAVKPLMDRPMLATSLSDFWGRRWNSGFGDLARNFIFAPGARILGATGATAIVFIVSGLLHDLVISLPAHGGYGRPTLYFLIQLAGLLLERTRPARRLMRMPLIGRIFAMVFVIAPLPLLFHPPFVHRVMIPFLHAIGGLP